MSKWFDIVGNMDVTREAVQSYKNESGVGLFEARAMAKADAVYSELTNMRYRLERFECMSDGEVLDELLELLMNGVNLR